MEDPYWFQWDLNGSLACFIFSHANITFNIFKQCVCQPLVSFSSTSLIDLHGDLLSSVGNWWTLQQNYIAGLLTVKKLYFPPSLFEGFPIQATK